MSEELRHALKLADMVLEKDFDPDADECVLARQLLRRNEAVIALAAENARLREALELRLALRKAAKPVFNIRVIHHGDVPAEDKHWWQFWKA